MIRVEGGKITGVGPRSAHIARLPYEIFSEALQNPKLELSAPLSADEKVFAVVSGSDGRRAALTLAGAAEKVGEVVARLISEYKLAPEFLCLAGGGSAGVIVPYLGKKMRMRWKIVKNATVISTIGVAMAMIREVVERTAANPTERDIKLIRHEVRSSRVQAGRRSSFGGEVAYF